MATTFPVLPFRAFLLHRRRHSRRTRRRLWWRRLMRRRTIRVQNVRAISKRVFLPHDPAPRVRPVFRSRFQQIPSHVRLSEIVLQVRRRWRREIDFSHVLDQSIDEQLLSSSSSSFVLPSSSCCCCCFPHEEGDDDIFF